MPDQANRLRRLARRCAAGESAALPARPRLILVAGGKGGVGTTTIAVHLAVALSGGGLRTVLVDADPCGGDAALLCGLEPRYGLADLADGRRTIDEILQSGPAAVGVVPGGREPRRSADEAAALGRRLVSAIAGLVDETDVVVMDVGRGTGRLTEASRGAADLLLAIATPDMPSIVGTFALLKSQAEHRRVASTYLLVNRAPTADAACAVHRRLALACRRFLATPLSHAGHLPIEGQFVRAAESAEPTLVAESGCEAAGHLARLAKRLAATLALVAIGQEGEAVASRAEDAAQPARRGKKPADYPNPKTDTFSRNGKIDSIRRLPLPIR